MKIKIAENIKALRKQHSFTQEQLAEALGVTVGAVYKWESGQSVPEVKLIMELADLFEISVDTLLGYDRQNENIINRIERIKQYVLEKDFDEAVLEAEKALKQVYKHLMFFARIHYRDLRQYTGRRNILMKFRQSSDLIWQRLNTTQTLILTQMF